MPFFELFTNLAFLPNFTLMQATLITLLAGFACVDRLASINIMLSRPFVIGSIVGLIFNNLLMGIFIGIIFEFIGMLEVPVGTRVTHDDTFAGLVATTLFVSANVPFNAFYVLLAVILISLAIYPVTASDRFFRYINRKMIDIKLSSNIENNHKETFIIGMGLLIAFLKGVIIYWLAIIIIYPIMQIIQNINFASYEELRFFQAPELGLMILFIFMSGYFIRFLNAKKNLYKVIAIVCGAIVGWFFL